MRLTIKHAGSGMVLTALLLGEAANIPVCRRDGGVGSEKGGCATERVKMARLAETTVSSLSSEVACGWGPVETRVPPNVESSEGNFRRFWE